MEVIDENGRVFGVVNVIDLLVALLVLAVLVAGVALVAGDGVQDQQQTESVTFTLRATDVQPYVADAIPSAGEVAGGNVTTVENLSVQPATIVTTNESGAVLVQDHPRLKTVTVEVTVEARQTEDELLFDRQRLMVGKNATLDFGTVELRGDVTSVERNTGTES